MGERLAEPGLIVAELALGDAKLLPGGGYLSRVCADDPVQGVHHGTRPRIAREVAVPDGLTFQVNLRGGVAMEDDAEGQPVVRAERNAADLVHLGGERLQAIAEHGQGVIRRVRPLAYGDPVVGVGFGGRHVLCQT